MTVFIVLGVIALVIIGALLLGLGVVFYLGRDIREDDHDVLETLDQFAARLAAEEAAKVKERA